MKYQELIDLIEDSFKTDYNGSNLNVIILNNVLDQIKTKENLYNLLNEIGISYNKSDDRIELKKTLRDFFSDKINELNPNNRTLNFN